MSIQILCPFLIRLFVYLLLSCLSSLYIFDINSLSDVWLANILSHSIVFFFTLLIISFEVKKLFILAQFYFSIFVFVACAFGVPSSRYIFHLSIRHVRLNHLSHSIFFFYPISVISEIF